MWQLAAILFNHKKFTSGLNLPLLTLSVPSIAQYEKRLY